jgi:drug/metabolite transporter superfamily protein YnfA
MGEFDDNAKFICDRLKLAMDDFTSLGRWGWGLLIAFLTTMLFETVKAKGQLFPPYTCKSTQTLKGADAGASNSAPSVQTTTDVLANADANEAAVGFLFVIIIAGLSYWYFLRDAKQKVLTARAAVFALTAIQRPPALDFAIRTAPTDFDLGRALALRAAIFVVLFVVWLMVFDMTFGSLWCMVSTIAGKMLSAIGLG